MSEHRDDPYEVEKFAREYGEEETMNERHITEHGLSAEDCAAIAIALRNEAMSNDDKSTAELGLRQERLARSFAITAEALKLNPAAVVSYRATGVE